MNLILQNYIYVCEDIKNNYRPGWFLLKEYILILKVKYIKIFNKETSTRPFFVFLFLE